MASYDVANLTDLINALASGAPEIIINLTGDITLSETVNIGDNVTINGGGHTINASAVVGYGLLVDGDNVVLSDFHLLGGSSYGIKVQPDTGVSTDTVTNFTISDVEISGSGISGLDLNGVDGATITNVVSHHNGGNGITLTNSAHVDLSGIETHHNAWGGVGIYGNGGWYNLDSSDIDFTGTNTHGEQVPVYGSNISSTDVTFEGQAGFLVSANGPFAGQSAVYSTDEEAIAAAQAARLVPGVTSVGIDGAGFAGTERFVDAGGSIQAAINAASAGDTIIIAAGTYNENITINKEGLTLIGAGSGTVIHGSFKAGNSISGSVYDWATTHASVTANGNGITVSADNVTISNLAVTDVYAAIELGNGVDGLTVDGVDLSAFWVGVRKGTAATVSDLTMTDVTFTDGTQGMALFKANSGAGTLDQVLFDGLTFTNLTQKGIYTEALSNAHLTNIVMTNVGQFGTTAGANGNGIDINLKYGTYSNIEIDHFTLNDVGSSNRDGAGASHVGAAAITVKARNDGSYSGSPANYTGTLSIHDGSIDGTATGIRVGEPGTNNLSPAVELSSVSVADASVAQVDNQSQATLKVVGTAGADTLDYTAPAGSDGPIVYTGGAGNDTINGHSAIDISTYAGPAADYSVKLVSGQWTVVDNNPAGLDEGTDTLTGIDKVQFSDRTLDLNAPIKVFDADGNLVATYAANELRNALENSTDGQRVEIANGDYVLTGSVVAINSDITVVGQSEAGVRIDATSIANDWAILVEHSGVSISDLTLFRNPAGDDSQPARGLKIQPDSSGIPVTGISLSDMTVSGFHRAEIDINGVGGATVTNVTVDGAGTNGAGIAITDSANIALDYITTEGNGWGGVAVYTNASGYPLQADNITFGDHFTSSDQQPILFQVQPGAPLGTVVLPDGYDYAVYNDDYRTDGSQFLVFFTSLVDAREYALQIHTATTTGVPTVTFNNTGSVIIADDSPGDDSFTPGNIYVFDGMSLQAAIDKAQPGDTIFVGPGSYTESANYNPSNNTNDPGFNNPLGLLINKSVTIVGVDANGDAITDAANVAATITASVESNWGTSFFVTAPNVTITGLNFVAAAPGGVSNKAFEIVEDDFTLAHSVVGAASGDIGAAIYINDDTASGDPQFVSDIASFDIHDNVLRGDFVLTNGPGIGLPHTEFLLTGNEFVRNNGSSVDWNWGVIITGRDDAVAWRQASIGGELVATGNSFSEDYTTDRLLFVRDDDASKLPDAQFVADFIADNNITTYAYAVDATGEPTVVELSTTNAFAMALTAGNGSSWANEGDTLIVKTDGQPAVETIVTDNLTVNALSAELDLELGGGVITLKLSGDQNTEVTGNSEDNLFHGNSAANSFDGGTGIDTLIANALPDASGLQIVDGKWVVTQSQTDVDTLSSVEIVDGAGAGKFLLVGAGGFASLQAAIDAAGDGDTILVAAGTYDLSTALIINKDLTFVGANAGIDGNAARGGESVLAGGLGALFDLGAGVDVTFNGFKLTGDHVIAEAQPDQSFTLTNSVVDIVATHANVFYFGYEGDDVHGYDVEFSHNAVTVKNYTEFFNFFGDGAFDVHHNTFTGVPGTYSAGGGNDVADIVNINSTSGTVASNTFDGVDIGVLIGGDAGPVSITGNSFENLERNPNGNDGDAAGIVFVDPAYTGPITIVGNTFDDSDAGIRSSGYYGDGTPPTLVGSESFVSIDGNEFTNVDDPYLLNIPGSITPTDSTIDGIPYPELFIGGSGDDSVTGTPGAEILQGGGGTDTFTVTTDTLTEANFVYDEATNTWTVTSPNGGTDALVHFEKVVDSNGNTFMLVDENGSYTSIQEAIDAAPVGATILIAAGTYNEDLNINKSVTLLGAKSGQSGTANTRDAANGVGEATIVGNSKITATGPVEIDGMRFLNNGTTTGGGPSNPTLQITTGANHVVTNSIFWSAVNGGANGVDDRAISFPTIGSGSVTISDNYISGAFASGFSGASWGRGIWFDGAGVGLTVSGNTIEYARTGLNLDMTGTSTAAIDGNTFKTNGTAVSVGVDKDGLTFSANNFVNVGAEFNLRALPGYNLDLTGAVASSTNSNPAEDYVVVYGGSGNDHIIGTDLSDSLDDNAAGASFESDTTADNDVLDGRGGNDVLVAEAGNDTLIGGAGNDTLIGGSGSDTAVFVDDLKAGDFQYNSGTGTWTVTTTNEGIDTLTGVERVEDSNGSFTLIASSGVIDGTEGIDLIYGSAGSDAIHAMGGDDAVFAGGGADTIVAGSGGGNDYYDGGAEGDTVTFTSTTSGVTVDLRALNRSGSTPLADAIEGVLATNGFAVSTPVGYASGSEVGTDVLVSVENATGGSGNDTFIGNAGNNIFDGGLGTDTADYSDTTLGMEFIRTSATSINAVGDVTEAGEDTLNNIERVIGGSGEDSYTGSSANDWFKGGAGADIFSASGGTDTFVVDGTAMSHEGQATRNSGTSVAFFDGTGTDTLLAVEQVQFDDVTISIVAGNAQLYTVADTATVDEDATVSRTAATGVLSNDINLNEGTSPGKDQKIVTGVSFGVTSGTLGSALSGAYGTLTLNANGSYSYVVDKALADTIAFGEGVTETFTYTAGDTATHLGSGATFTQSLTFTISGTNDAPVVTVDGSGAVTEDTAVNSGMLTDSGTLTITDADGTDVITPDTEFVGATWTGGALTTAQIDALSQGFTIDGNSWDYAVANSAVQFLAAGETVTLTYQVTATDDSGQANNSDTETVTITITGQNDAPVLGFQQGFETNTAGIVTGGGYGAIETQTNWNGVTAEDGGTFAVVTQTGSGPYSRLGEHRAEFTDGLEAGVKVYLDPDMLVGEGFSYSVAVMDYSAPPSFFLRDYIFHVTRDAGGLKVSASNNTNFNPQVGPNPSTISEAGWYTLQHVFNDAGGVLSVDLNVIDSTGAVIATWTLSNPGDTLDHVDGVRYGWFTNVDVTSGIAVDTVTLGDFSGRVVELVGTDNPNMHTVDGGIPFTDVDQTDGHTLEFDAQPPGYLGTFDAEITAPSDGAMGVVTWTFTVPDTEIDFLAEGETLIQTYTITLDDGNGGTAEQTVTVTITGTNDVPVIVAEAAGTLVDTGVTDTFADVTGQLDATDVDSGAVLSYALAAGEDGLSPYGVLTVAANGSYTFVPNAAAINALAVGDDQTVVFDVSVSDGIAPAQVTTLTISITAANDVPVIVAEAAGTLVDTGVTDTFADVTGQLDATDVDSGAVLSYALAAGEDGLSPYGVLTVAANGSYTFVPNAAAINALAVGDDQTVVFDVSVSDGIAPAQVTTLTISITASNDVPVIVAEAAGTLVDTGVTDTFADVTGQLDATDVDSGAVLSYALAAGEDGLSPYGVLTVAANGSYTFVPNAAAINALAVGDDQTVVFDVSVSDGIAPAQVTTLTISITASNDVPVIVAEAAGTLVDTGVTDTFADVTGQLDATDVDSGAVLSYALAAGEDGLSPYGVLTVAANGSYTFVPNAAAINALAVGDDQTVVFDVSVSDGIAPAQVTTLTISITAANDVPVAVADTGTASENETKFFDVVGNDTDVDVPDTKTLTDIGTITVSSANPAINGLVLPAGVFTIVGNQLKFLPGTAFDALNPTEVATVTVGYTMADTAGATSTLTLTVNGDAENGTANDDLLSGTNSPDAINGLGGDDTIVALGGDDTINAGDGDDQVDGGSGNDQIHGDAGDDDLDGGSGDDVFYGEAGDDTYDGGSHIAGDEIHFTGERSEYTVTKSGTTYTIVHNVDSSSPGYTGIDTVTRVEKFYFGAGPTLYTGDAVLDPPPAPTVPEAIDDTLAASLTEDSSIVFAIGNVGSNDTGGGPLTYSGWNGTSAVYIVQGTYGTFQFNADGTVLYQLDSALADELSPADHVQDHAVYRVSGPGGADTGTVSVNITGANDAPVLSADTFAALAENAIGNFAVLANDADPEDDPLQISSLVALTNANISGLDHFLNATELATLNSYFTIGVGGQSIVFNPGAGLGVSGVQSLFDSLGVGQNATINLSYKVSDGSLESTGTLTFTVNGAIETYNGTAGNDAWIGIQGVSERFIGNGGIDQVTYGNMATGVYVNLATGATGGSAAGDILEGITRVFGSRVAGDEIIGSTNNDRIYGLGGDDLLSGAGGNDFIWGGLGSDIITGNDGDDTMFGEEGDDVIDGGLGADSYLGGSGRDVFVFKNLEVAGTKDSIVDFQDGLDTIEFTRSAMHLASDFDFSDFTVVGNGTKTVELFWNDIDGGLHRIRIDSSTGDPMTIGVSDFSMLA